jgi:hypothetical protein
MKKLALSLVALGFLSAPVFACPGHDKDVSDNTPKVAEKDKKAPVKKAPVKKAPAKKTDDKKTDSTVAKK